jgi:acyl-coenzyme A synthetase/AMP-(fatty) acid ligase
MAFATVRDRYSEADIASFYADGLWRPETFFEVAGQQADRQPDKVFVTDGTTSLTFSELHDSALALTAGLHRLGIGSGDRVSVQLPSWTEFTQISLALTRIGAIMVPIMPIYRRDDVSYVLRNAGVRTAITCGPFRNFDYPGMYRSLRPDCPELRDLIVARPDGSPGDAIALETLFAGQTAQLGPAAGPDDPFVIVFSSGTTARPKGCLHTFGCGSRLLARAFGYSSRDIQFSPSPVTHTTGLITGFLLLLMHGASVHLMEAWEPRAGLADIAKFHTTAAVTATTFLQTLMDAYDPDQHDPSSMRLWVAAGSPIPAAFVRRAAEVLPNLRVLSLYGHPAIRAVAVVGMPDDKLGEKVCGYAVVSPGENLTLPEVADYLLAQGLAIQKVPERLEIVPELPMTATGKIRKHVLRADIAAKLSSA